MAARKTPTKKGGKRAAVPWQKLAPVNAGSQMPAEKENRPLTPKEARFVREYLIDCNAARAAAAAGYSRRNAKQLGHQLVTRACVAAAISAKSEAIAQKLDITVERTVEELARLAYAPVGKKRGQIDPKNKIAALTALGKYQRIFVERHEVIGGAQFTLTVRKAAGQDV